MIAFILAIGFRQSAFRFSQVWRLRRIANLILTPTDNVCSEFLNQFVSFLRNALGEIPITVVNTRLKWY